MKKYFLLILLLTLSWTASSQTINIDREQKEELVKGLIAGIACEEDVDSLYQVIFELKLTNTFQDALNASMQDRLDKAGEAKMLYKEKYVRKEEELTREKRSNTFLKALLILAVLFGLYQSL